MTRKNYTFRLFSLWCCLALFGSGTSASAYSHAAAETAIVPHQLISGMQTPGIRQLPAPFPAQRTSGRYFIENKGQIRDQYGIPRTDIDFRLVTGNDINVFIGSGKIHYQWNEHQPQTGMVHSYRMDFELTGARRDVQAETQDANGYFEMYYNSGRQDAATRAETFKKVVYRDVYPNIDWVLYLKGNVFEYDFVVRPGGKVSDIRMQYKGATGLGINRDGSLTASTPKGSITENAPVSFEDGGQPVTSRFALHNGSVGFRVGKYNTANNLIIDPVVEWATYYGGVGPGYTVSYPWDPNSPVTEWDVINATAVDGESNVYITGYTNSLNNIATTGSFQETWGGSVNTSTAPNDAFLAKFDQHGTRLWGTYYGGQGSESGNSIICDENDNVYMAISAGSPDLATPGSHQPALNGSSDGMVIKFDGQGNRIWATYLGGDETDAAVFIVSDKGGHIYVGGNTYSSNGIAVGNIHQNTFGGTRDAFLAKLTEDGDLLWATYYGGPDDEEFFGLAWDRFNQKIYLAGTTKGSTMIATPGAHQETIGGEDDAFLVKFSSDGVREWATYYGSEGYEFGYSTACDDAGNVYMSGMIMFGSEDLATPGAFQDTLVNNRGNFLVKFYPDGTRHWATFHNGSAAHVSTQGFTVYLGGQTSDTLGIATPDAIHDTLIGFDNQADVFFARFDTTGVKTYGTYFGSGTNDNGGYLSTDGKGNIYMAGRTFDPVRSGIKASTPGSHQDSFATGGHAGSYDGFLVKFSDCVYDLAMTIDSFTLGVSGSGIYVGYQWFKDGSPIEGATDDTYTATENAVYSVRVTAVNGCEDSTQYEIDNIIDDGGETSVTTTSGRKEVRFYPNPAQHSVYVQTHTPVHVQVRNVAGRLVTDHHQPAGTGRIDISTLAPGLYLLQIHNSEGKLLQTEKLVKETR